MKSFCLITKKMEKQGVRFAPLQKNPCISALGSAGFDRRGVNELLF